jgi:hypothetical protein
MKRVTLLLIAVLTMSSMLMVNFEPTSAELPTPSVPEFTVKLINYSVVEVTIKNQPFTSYYDDSLGQHVFLDYNIRLKGYFEGGWTEFYRASDGYLHQWSDSDYTVRTLRTEIGTGITIALRDGFSLTFPAGVQVDFQVEAMIGYVHRDISQAFAPWVFTGEKSGWSNTQTLALSTASSPPTPSPETTPFPTNHTGVGLTETEIIIGAIVAAAVIGAGLGFLIYLIKRR